MRLQLRNLCSEDRLPASLHPLLRRVYLNRGLAQAEELDLSLERLLPFNSLKGIDEAVLLLVCALDQQWRVLVVGDYDADGATGTAVAVTALRQFGLRDVGYLVPDRFRYGYGLTPEIVQLARVQQPDLLITVDNGISSIEGVAAARLAGMRVLITDHHLPGAVLPDADAMVNPNQPGCAFPSKALAGVGVIFYVMIALRAQLRARGAAALPNLAELLDLVALGTVADVVPLDQNNRILVQNGLSRMRTGRARPGLRALAQVAGRSPAQLTSGDLGFFLGPRLNAAGRLENMARGIECLMSQDDATALTMARELDTLNRERRDLQTQMQEEALAVAESIEARHGAEELPYGLCLYDAAWHQGVVGLVATRLRERYHRPAIVFAPGDEAGATLKGSGRSVPGFHIRDALDAIAARHPGLISRFGGHAMAAGLSLEHAQLAAFTEAFAAETRRLLRPEQIQRVIESDGELSAADCGLEGAQALRDGGPWGQGFPEPQFHGHFEVAEARVVGEQHLKLKLRRPEQNHTLDAIAFRETRPLAVGSQILAAYRLEVNEYRGLLSPQLVIEALEPA
ncbi:MAG: single-stranded-DNA-specific exonuclease RecJ [Nevskiales bacterium]